MSLRTTCRELVIEGILRRALGVDGSDGRLQIVVDEATMKVLNSFLRMGDLHAEGVTSMELLDRPREPLPDLDALYLIKATASNVELVLNDFQHSDASGTAEKSMQKKSWWATADKADAANTKQPQHRHVHIAFSQSIESDLMGKLAGSPQLAPRIKSFVEVPLSFLTIQDRGFHFDMLDALPHLFPNPDSLLARSVAGKLADVCRCLGAVGPALTIKSAHSSLCKSVAEHVQAELALCRQLPPKDGPVPCQLLIVDRSIDMAATLVHEYSYEALVYDLLDGVVLDSSRNVVTMQGREILLSDADALWEEVKHLHFIDAGPLIQARTQQVCSQHAKKDASQISTAQMLEMVRKMPEMKEAIERVQLHNFLYEKISERMAELAMTNLLGPLEQDIACGIDQGGKSIKESKLQDQLLEKLSGLSSEVRLRLLMLFFASMSNVPQTARDKMINMAKLEADDQQVLQAMLKTKLMEVPDSQRHKQDKSGTGYLHRVTKEQAARFKRNATADGAFVLSRFEPRMRELIQKLAEQTLTEDDYPTLGGAAANGRGVAPASGLRLTAGSYAMPMAPKVGSDPWSFGETPELAVAEKADAVDISSRLIVFVIGGITYSELRAAAQMRDVLPRSTDVLIGGTALLTAKRLISTLRPTKNPFEEGIGASTEDPEDLT